MPRKAPDTVNEHRITFGDFERREVKQVLDGIENQFKRIEFAQNAVAVAACGGAAALGFAAYSLYTFVAGELPEIKEKVDKGLNWFLFGDDDKFFFWDSPFADN